MKTFWRLLRLNVMTFFILSSCTITRNTWDDNGPQEDAITYQQFYDVLSPYGHWIDYPGYGYVWSANELEFKPYYTNGYWDYTQYGWTWISGYSWGWAPFHYGRWFYETGYGWLWIPGYEWAPAWVCWRNSEDYYGWAPLAPGMSLNFYVGINIPFEHWIFIPHQYIRDRHFHEHSLREQDNENAFKRSQFIRDHGNSKNRTIYSTGPSVKGVRRIINEKVTPLPVRDYPAPDNTTVKDGSLRIFKPPVRQTDNRIPIKPKVTIPFKDIPHNNGKRGTWTAPQTQDNKSGNPARVRRF